MREFRKRNITDNKYIVLLHILMGIAMFYVIIHPLTMIIYWFEMSNTPFSINQFFEVAPERIAHSFSFKMMGMSIAFIIIGSLIGLGSGFYYRNIVRKTKLLRLQEKVLKRNIISIIQGGENDKVEFKSSLRYDYNKNITNASLEEVIVKTIAGFMNANGGDLLIGVDDNGNILGLEHDYISLRKKNQDGFELKIYQLINNYIGIEFCSLVQLTFFSLDGNDICVLRIDSSESPVYIHKSDKTAFYVRVGNSTKPMTIKEAVKYIDNRRRDSK
jgi:schlafen family protein